MKTITETVVERSTEDELVYLTMWRRARELEQGIIMVQALTKNNDNPDLPEILNEAEMELNTLKNKLCGLV